jgi:hypothetical protein
MFKYLFNGTLYEADTIEALNTLLVAAGYDGNVIEEFNAVLKDEEKPEDIFDDEQPEDIFDDEALKQVNEIDLINDQLETEEANKKDA